MSKIPVVKSNRPTVDLVLIDADILRYEIGAVQLDHQFIAGAKVPAPSSFIDDLVRNRIETIIERTGAKYFVLFFTEKGNFRFEIAKQQTYKGNRADSEKPYHWATVNTYLRNAYPSNVFQAHGNEADDELGILQLHSIYEKPYTLLEGAAECLKDLDITKLTTAIASRDKDLGTVEGWHYRWACGEFQPEVPLHYITQFDGYRFFFKQMLTGDDTDHICGCGEKREVMWGGELKMRRQGVGEKTAWQLLDGLTSVQEMFNLVKTQYIDFFGEEAADDKLLENAKLLFIGQRKEQQFKWSWIEGLKAGEYVRLDKKVVRTRAKRKPKDGLDELPNCVEGEKPREDSCEGEVQTTNCVGTHSDQHSESRNREAQGRGSDCTNSRNLSGGEDEGRDSESHCPT